MKADIVLVLSDQHSGLFPQLPGGDGTPFLNRLGRQGMVFSRAYCNAPLCVPSRCSFLTGRLPHSTGIFDNDSVLPEDVPTLAHAMALAGYETVLAGRMHFKGSDQNHGFSRRLVGDITTQYWGAKRQDLGDFAGSLQAASCQKVAGCGSSPVSAYDEAVTLAVLEELSSPHSKPLFLVVGLYAPHFPYVASQEAFLESIREEEDVRDLSWPSFSCYRDLVQSSTPERLHLIRTAYRAAIRELDSRVERIYQTYRAQSPEGIFLYLSDHGDQLGCRGLFGKKTMYEPSVRVPLILEDGVHHGVCREAVSLIDVTQTLLDYADARLPGCQGVSLFSKNRPPVRIESMLDDGSALIQAAIQEDKKLLRLPEKDILCCWDTDPREETDFSPVYPQDTVALSRSLLPPEQIQPCLENYRQHRQHTDLLKAWGRLHPRQEPARFAIPPESVRREDPYYGQQWLGKNNSTGDTQ